ncbi:cytochrome P450 [Aaosphaeria arxii CBS 175.79]|uniref:Cytochrome P450 n=1 Tax=Aaosphaeria arxii CBS 175.79 TaxID=1450172 RepID=A0A6A5X926_9PLEO|nr:cytochrome P450 [Aaosphaeria arxii CBS 175.79]KAF2009431.1 cytochrome P450 [Aaosphaeria arxii CBS 175.79]
MGLLSVTSYSLVECIVGAGAFIWYAYHWMSGYWFSAIEGVHQKYGTVVRIAPNELSFCSTQSLKDIYSHPLSSEWAFLKSSFYDRPFGVASVATTRDPHDHRQQRQSLASGFSTKALREQEDIVHYYVDLFIQQIGNLSKTQSYGVDICEALNWVTFDIIGDLTFGESFDAVKTAKTHHWVSTIVDSQFWGSIIPLSRRVVVVYLLLPFLAFSNLARNFKIHQGLTRAKLANRIAKADKITRADFLQQVIQSRKFSIEALEGQAGTLIVAGSETTATTSVAALYFLAKNPVCLAALQHEVRTTFTSADAITGHSTATLPHLNAVIEESLRLFPPVAIGLPRISPGANVDGHFIPAGVIVSTDNWTLMHDPKYWHDPHAFRPERWIGEGFGDTKGASQPFSLGVRACLGINLAYLEMRVVLAKIIWHYDLQLIDGDRDLLRESTLFGFWKKPPIHMKFNGRENSALGVPDVL